VIKTVIKTLYTYLIWGLCCTAAAQAQPLFNPQNPSFAPLTAQEQQYAETAWAYFAQNTDAQTGLVPSVRKFQSMTMWDQGGYLMATTAAYKLGLISRDEATGRMLRVFNSAARLPLYQGKLPNKAYNITTLAMTDYANKPTPQGIGWSALDIMRFITGMLVVTETFPELLPYAQRIIRAWDIAQLSEAGRFRGLAVRGKTNGRYVQEGRIGYEQYAGRAGMKIGLPVDIAAQYDPILRWQGYYGLNLPGDARTAKTHGVSALTTSEPFLLEALEMGWRDDAFWVASHVFDAQVFRYNQTGQITALSEDHIKGPPYFAYNAILVDHEPFKTVTASRIDASNKRTISTKASFGWWATLRHPYTQELIKTVEHLQTDYGWYAGVFEADMSPNAILTLNTNAVILEALHYKFFGPFLN